LNGLTHTRHMVLSSDGRVLQGMDQLTSEAPLVKPVNVAIRFHLHPRVQASLIQDGAAALIRLPSGSGWRLSKEGGVLALEPGIYCGTGSSPRKTMQLVLYATIETENSVIYWDFQEES